MHTSILRHRVLNLRTSPCICYNQGDHIFQPNPTIHEGILFLDMKLSICNFSTSEVDLICPLRVYQPAKLRHLMEQYGAVGKIFLKPEGNYIPSVVASYPLEAFVKLS